MAIVRQPHAPKFPFVMTRRANRRTKMTDDKKMHGTLPTSDMASNDKQGKLANQMQTVKSTWDKAPEGAKKANALKHYQLAEKAQKAGNDADAMKELDEAARALR
jgi:hypothetical protein